MIKNLTLQNFRNYKKKTLEFSEKTTVIIGTNASGKTNILEGLFFLSTGKSFRARIEEEMINYDEEIARVKGVVKSSEGKIDLEGVFTRGKIKIGEDKFEKVPKKKLLVNGVPRKLLTFAGNLKIVLFGPWDLELVTESPSIRRKFLDTVLSQVDGEYRRAILSYEKGLRQRNKLLFQIREEGIPRSSLLFWDQLLIKNGNYISDKRSGFIEFVNKSPDFPNFAKSSLGNGQDFNLDYDASSISEGRLNQYKDEEVSAATTLVGPHRDDFLFQLKKTIDPDDSGQEGKKGKFRDLSKYGSRGEQRMGVLWLKLAELSFIKEMTEEIPVLLLDDIFSELDHEHREIVMNVTKNQQTIITTADEHFVEDFKKGKVINLS